mgnify:CR=1 FL=1
MIRSKGQVRTGREDPCEAPPMIQIIIKTRLNLKDAKNSYLGVMLSNDLKWNSHVNKIVAKANRSLGCVKRNFYPCTETTKCSGYVIIVRPTLEYATAVWDPFRQLRQEQIDSIEAVQSRVQRCAARSIKRDCNRTSFITEILTLDFDPL